MEPLKPRDKVTQHMTRDGLTLDNQTTGESVNVSSREAEQEYTAQPEGAAEKILERADELHDRHKARKAAKDAGKTVAQATGPVSRLQFTAEERASPELAPYIKKAEKRADQLEATKEALAGRFSPQCKERRKGHQDTGPGPVQGEKGSAKAGRTGQAGDG